MHGFCIFIRFQACYVACHLKATNASAKLSFFRYFLLHINARPLVVKHGLNTRLNNKTSCSRDCIHFRLTVVSRITVFIVSLNVNAAFSLRSSLSSPFAG